MSEEREPFDLFGPERGRAGGGSRSGGALEGVNRTGERGLLPLARLCRVHLSIGCCRHRWYVIPGSWTSNRVVTGCQEGVKLPSWLKHTEKGRGGDSRWALHHEKSVSPSGGVHNNCYCCQYYCCCCCCWYCWYYCWCCCWYYCWYYCYFF